MTKILHIIIIFIVLQSSAQTDMRLIYNLDVPISEFDMEIDSTSLSVLKIPFLGFDIAMSSNPRIQDFLYQEGTSLIFNPFVYADNIESLSSHLIEMDNNIFYYLLKRNQQLYSFGIDHKLFLEGVFSEELISLMIHGNYQFLNQEISLTDNRIRGYNYMSLFFGYSQKISNTIIGGKIKLLNGVFSFGFNGGNSTLFSVDNYVTSNTPFSTLVSSDWNAYYTDNLSIGSNLGFGLDVSVKHTFSNHISVFGSISDVGFISWREKEYSSTGTYLFNGLDYIIDDDLVAGFTNIYDTIVDIFSIETTNNLKNTRHLPYQVDLGFNYLFDNIDKNQLTFNYNFQKLNITKPLSTYTIAYTTHFDEYQLSIIPMYSLNRISKTNFSLFINKKWKDGFVTNLYAENIFNMLGLFSSSLNATSLGFEMFLLF